MNTPAKLPLPCFACPHSSGEFRRVIPFGAVTPPAGTARAAEVTPKGAERSEAPRVFARLTGASTLLPLRGKGLHAMTCAAAWRRSGCRRLAADGVRHGSPLPPRGAPWETRQPDPEGGTPKKPKKKSLACEKVNIVVSSQARAASGLMMKRSPRLGHLTTLTIPVSQYQKRSCHLDHRNTRLSLKTQHRFVILSSSRVSTRSIPNDTSKDTAINEGFGVA